MSNLYIQAQTLTDIADAIRDKTGTSAAMTPSQMASAIGSISGGDTTLEDGLITGNLTSYENSRVSYVRSSAFHKYDSLTTVSFPNATSIGAYAFYDCRSLTTVNFPNVTNIGSSTFQDCRLLTTINFPNVISIASTAFYSCHNLTVTNFPNTINIGVGAFGECRSLTTVNFPNVTDISNNAFTQCSSLTTASFPNIQNISNLVFQRCYHLLSLYLLGSSIPALSNSNVFSSTPIAGYTTSTGGVYGSIYVPASLYSSYLTATNWTLYSSRFVSV